MGTVSFNKRLAYIIPNGSTNGPTLGCGVYEDMVAMIIEAPAVLAETFTFQVNSERDGSGTWTTVQDDTAVDLAGPTAGKARFYPQFVHASAFRMVASVAVGANRTFYISGQWTT